MPENQTGPPASVLLRGADAGGADATAAAPRGRQPWSPGARILVLASLVGGFLATSSTPTPLYATYARVWRLTAASTSLAFGVYALSLLAALLLLGRLSDHIGRRPVLVAAIAGQIVALAVFAGANGLGPLLVGRILQGLSTGAGVAAVGAALLDVDARRGTVANSVAPAAGSAIGAMASALAVQFLPAPTRLIYAVFVVVLLVQTLALARVPETSPCAPGALASLRPRVRLPAAVRGNFAAAAPVLFAIWALSGLFGSLGPALVQQVTGSSSVVPGTVPLAIVGAVSPITAYRLRAVSPRSSLAVGITALIAGVVVTVLAVLTSSGLVLFVGAVLGGVSFGSGFRGGMQLLLPAVEPGERAGTLASVYVVSYLGFGIPAIIAGVVDARTGSVSGTTLGYSACLLLLALVAGAALRRTPAGQPTARPQQRAR